MNFKLYLYTCTLFLLFPVFSWTAAYADTCSDALKMVPALSSLKGDALVASENNILRLCNKGPAAHIVNGMRSERSADLKQAVTEYRAALSGLVHGAAPDDFIRQGDDHLLAREYRKAIKSYQTALKKRPDWPEALQKLADAYTAAGDDEQAIEVLRKSIKHDEKNRDAHYALGVLYERNGKLTEAEAELRASLRSDPGNGDAHRHLADIYTIQGNFPQAIREYRDLLVQQDDNSMLHFKLARAYERSRHDQEAIAEYKISVKLAPDNAEANKELAMLYHRKGMLDKAEHHYQETLRLKSDDRYSRNALTSIYVKQKKYKALLALLKDETKLFPENPDSHYRLGLIQYFMKDFDAAQQEYQTTVTLKPNHAKALKGLGKIAIIRGDRAGATKFMLASQKADPNLPEAKQMLNELKEGDPFQPKPQKIKKRAVKKKHGKSIKKSVSSKKSGKSVKKSKHSKKHTGRSAKKSVKKKTKKKAH